MKRELKRRTAALLLALLFMGGSVTASAATQGSADNPLVTLSYLQTTFTQAILQQLDSKISATQDQFVQRLQAQIAAFSDEMKNLSQSGAAVFETVKLQSAQGLRLSAGSELLLRSGSAQVSSGESPALIDQTDGGASGTGLTVNHLYLVSAATCTISGDATLLVRGSYTVE